MPNVLSCNEMFGTRDFTFEVNGATVSANLVRRFKVVLDSGGPGADVAASNANGLPFLRDPHPYDPFARCKSVRGQSEANDDKIWVVEATYTYDTQDESQQPENPLDEPPQVAWGFQQFQKVLQKDINGKALLNTADEQFDPLPEVDDSRLVLSYQRNEAYFPVALAREYQDAVNSDAFLGAPAGTVKCQNINATRQFRNDVYFWAVSYEFHFRSDDDDWELHILNQGYRTTLDDSYSIVSDQEGRPMNQPVLLDIDGQELTEGADPIFLDYKAYREKPFSAFNISF